MTGVVAFYTIMSNFMHFSYSILDNGKYSYTKKTATLLSTDDVNEEVKKRQTNSFV